MISLNAIELPSGLRWQSDFNYCPIKQESKTSITGRVILNRGKMFDGRPVVLVGNGNAWLTLAEVKTISSLRLTPAVMELNYHGTTYNVRWDYGDESHFVATPLFDKSDAENDGDQYTLETIKLIEVLE
ncbi:hypothetical protein OW492_00505 [Psychromonas sp. 14N.309.X.WAT.B.A12]|uniref:hypothetical protein n=1 Tax=Psychromonas sp. 14N.309.X.WAT.B.A12 TaxID=2998322 RepID=UPI0025B1C099|nr:hypothetical protein [Psychromonas sp. 14N.309.X.WAT.B.A12]MDN2661852.1 hypothetical protein [Psychromonas sp. 14N.309.X.WAT.B.A12]